MNYSYLVQQRRELAAFARLLSSYGCAADGDKMCGECGPCEAHAWLERHELLRPKEYKLSDREREVLHEMPTGEGWLRPMDCGGRDGSDHSAVLMRLVTKGYVEMKPWGGHVRGSWRYRKLARPTPETKERP